MIYRRTIIQLGLVFIALATATGTFAADKVRVSVAHKGLWDTGIPVLVAQQQGFFEKQELDVDISYMRGGPEGIQALLIGERDIASAIGTLATLGAIGKSAPIKIIAAEFTGSEMFWYAKESSGIKSMSDLDGKAIGHNLPGTSAHLATLALNDAIGGGANLVMAGRMPDNMTQVLSGQIDVGYAVPPYALKQIAEGELVMVARGVDLDSVRNLTTRTVLASSSFMAEHRDVAVRYIQAIDMAHDWMYSNLDEALELYADVNELPVSILETVIEFYARDSVRPGNMQGLDDTNQMAVEYGFLPEPLTEAELDEAVDLVLPAN